MNTETEFTMTESHALASRSIDLMEAHTAIGNALKKVWLMKHTAKMVNESGVEFEDRAKNIHINTITDLTILAMKLQNIQDELQRDIQEVRELQGTTEGRVF
jgi:hypothetical protein